MEKQLPEDELGRSVVALEEPHFDCEAKLAAKRVVPLSSIKKTQPGFDLKKGRYSYQSPFVFGFIVILGSAVMGLLGGLTITEYYFRLQQPEEAAPVAESKPLAATPDSESEARFGNRPEVPSDTVSVSTSVRDIPPKDHPTIVLAKTAVRSSVNKSLPGKRKNDVGSVRASKKGRQIRNIEQAPKRPERRIDVSVAKSQAAPSIQRRRRSREIDRIRDIFTGEDP